MPYLSASAMVIHYEEVLYQVYGPYLTLICYNSYIHQNSWLTLNEASILQFLPGDTKHKCSTSCVVSVCCIKTDEEIIKLLSRPGRPIIRVFPHYVQPQNSIRERWSLIWVNLEKFTICCRYFTAYGPSNSSAFGHCSCINVAAVHYYRQRAACIGTL